MTLFACSLVLLGVAMLASAALRSLQDDVSLTYSTIDRLLAQHAAEAALRDAAATLPMIPKQLTMVQAQGSHHLGDITGERFAQGGPMQSCAVPEYLLEMLPQPPNADPMQTAESSPHRYRVTAKGKGISETTTVILQAEFEAQICAREKNDIAKDVQNGHQNDLQNSVQSSGKNDEKISEQIDAKCIPHVRRLAWRMLHTS
jgi:Tfp pilus assembly protein PilX